MAHKHSVYDTDKHFTINPITRVVKNDPSHKATVIQFDHNSERFTFELPRFVEGHDMTECNKVEVHYLNVDTKTKEERRGVYISDDLKVSADDENVVVCSWLISGNATELVGTLSFVVRYCCVEGDVVTYAWNTAVATVNVSTGINGSDMVIAEYADVLEKWKAELFNAGYINADTMKANIANLSDALNVERKRIDNIVKLPNGSTTGDAELADIRVGADGVTYDSAGAAVREQFCQLSDEINSYFKSDGMNILDNSAVVNGRFWDRQYGDPSTIYMKEVAGGFCFPPVRLKANKAYHLTPAALHNAIILIGAWDESDGSYVGEYYRANACDFVDYESIQGYDGYGAATITPTDNCWLFFSSTTVANIGNQNTAMVFEGVALPEDFVAFGERKNLQIPELRFSAKSKKTIIVGKESNFADYDTIQAACDNANEGDTIIVLSGTYNESVVVIDKEVHIVGVDKKNCVLEYHSNSYDYHPISIARGSLQNMTVHAVKDNGATENGTMPYAVHIDFDYEKGGEMLIDNCVLIGDWQAALGVGMKGDFVMTVKNTDLISNADTTNGALFFHDNVIAGYNGKSALIVDRCNIRNTAGTYAIMPKSFGNPENETNMTFINTLIYSVFGGASEKCVGVGRDVTGDGWRNYNNFFLTGDSYGNNIALFNK